MNAAKIIVACAALLSLHAREIVFPPDKRAILNIKTELGAKGDGIADDTEAIQTAIERCRAESRTIYLPNGTYRVTRTIVFKPPGDGKEGSMVGPWIYGQDRDKTIIKLADRQEGFTDSASPREMIRGVSRPDGARMNADFFDQIVCNLTMDTGDNPGAIGIKYYSNNTGLMKDVVVRGNGACGIDLGFVDQNGPHLIQDVEIAGFVIGMRTSRILNSQTLSRVTIRDAREVGLLHRGQVLSVEQLRVINSPLAVDSGEDGVLSLVDADLSAANSTPGPAILLGEGHLYVARLKTSGFATAIAAPDAPNGSVKEALVDQYSSHPVEKVGKDLPDSGLLLRTENEPMGPFPCKASD
ncbi:MAG: glycosyl hydrolase family 28-related protein, partial [Limisphaerales bacterium]